MSQGTDTDDEGSDRPAGSREIRQVVPVNHVSRPTPGDQMPRPLPVPKVQKTPCERIVHLGFSSSLAQSFWIHQLQTGDNLDVYSE